MRFHSKRIVLILLALGLSALAFLNEALGNFGTWQAVITTIRDSSPLGKRVLEVLDSTAGRFTLLLVGWVLAYVAASMTRPDKPRMSLQRALVTEPVTIWGQGQFFVVGGGPTTPSVNRAIAIGMPRFSEVWFRNDPEETGETSIARDVAGHLKFYRADGTPACPEMSFARWAGNPHPTNREDIMPSSMTTFPPNAVPQALNIALKYDDKANVYAFGNSVIINPRANGWRDPIYTLPAGAYWVSVELRGNNVRRKRFWVKLENDGEGTPMRLLVAKPSIRLRLKR